MTEEVWKPIDTAGYDVDDKHEVSNLGRIRHRLLNDMEGRPRYRYMGNAKSGNYKIIRLLDKTRKEYIAFSVQVLVLKAFSNYDPELRVVHINGDNSDCRLENLMQMTHKDIAKEVKKEKRSRHSKVQLIKCDIETRDPIKVYDYYSDAVRDIYKKTTGRDKSEMTEKEKIKMINNLRYTVMYKTREPVMYGYYWRKRNRTDLKDNDKDVKEKEAVK